MERPWPNQDLEDYLSIFLTDAQRRRSITCVAGAARFMRLGAAQEMAMARTGPDGRSCNAEH